MKKEFGTTHHQPVMSGAIMPQLPIKKPEFLPLIDSAKLPPPVFERLIETAEPKWLPMPLLEVPAEPLSKELQEYLAQIVEALQEKSHE